MKKYYIYAIISILTTIVYFGTPQLSTGKIFINNIEEQKPTDWLSAIIKQFFYETESNHPTYHIPKNIKTIVFQGKVGQITSSNLSQIYLLNDASISNQIKNINDSHIKYSIKNDTLILKIDERNLYKHVYIDSTIQDLVFDNVKKTEVSNNQPYPIKFHLTNRSDITISGNTNRKLNKFNVNEQSTLNLNYIFTPSVNINIENSMVYIDPLNNIDSLHAHLRGKSNIQIKNTLKEWQRGEQFEKIKQYLQIDKTSLNIFATGNLEYYNISNKTTKGP